MLLIVIATSMFFAMLAATYQALRNEQQEARLAIRANRSGERFPSRG